MKEIQTDELRELQMQILDHVDAFCRKYNIKYTISGGTLLGAVRHGGFIPWDDDIDIQMLRREYNRFCLLWKEKNNHPFYKLESIETGSKMGYPWGKVHDSRTVTYVGKLERTGIFIDIFPLDKVKDVNDWKVRHNKIKKLHKERAVVYYKLRSQYEEIGIKKRIWLLLKDPHKTYQQIAEEIDVSAKVFEDKDYSFVYEMVSGLKCKKPMPLKLFNQYVDIHFEDRIYMSVRDVDLYLSLTFGDYMKLPPESEQRKLHEFIPYWRT